MAFIEVTGATRMEVTMSDEAHADDRDGHGDRTAVPGAGR